VPRRPTSLPLTLPPRPAGSPAYLWLYGAIREQVVSGRLEPGCRLPSTRDLARQFAMSRGTAVTAFEMLLAEGYLESASGSGTSVSRALPRAWGTPSHPHLTAPAAGRPLAAAARRAVAFRQHGSASNKAFRANQPALDLFPSADWARTAARTLRHASPSLLAGGDPLGYLPLRIAITEYLAVSRGVVCSPDRVAIVSGLQDALAAIGTVLVDPGDTACVEDPGYGGAARVLQMLGARVRSLAIDGDGARVPSGRLRARLAYVTPAHQFPLAVSMTMTRRLEWLRWAAATGAVIFEDDYDSEFRYTGHPVAALQGLDRDHVVVFAGSLSKVLCPSLRLGYLVLPPDLVDPVAAVLSIVSRQASLLNQAVLTRFMADGHFARHLRRMRDVYAERHGTLLDGARRWLDGGLEVRAVNAGLQTVGLLASGRDGAQVATHAADCDVEVVPLQRYARSPLRRDGVQLGFAAVPPVEITRGLQVLARVLEQQARCRPG
jgi:GntR family transcriptional regulator/MocR family aminotransferase